MNVSRTFTLLAVTALLAVSAPPAQASELVKLARLIVTGKRSPAVTATEGKTAPTSSISTQKLDTPQVTDRAPGPASVADDAAEPASDSAPRTEPASRSTDRVSQSPHRGSLG